MFFYFKRLIVLLALWCLGLGQIMGRHVGYLCLHGETPQIRTEAFCTADCHDHEHDSDDHTDPADPCPGEHLEIRDEWSSQTSVAGHAVPLPVAFDLPPSAFLLIERPMAQLSSVWRRFHADTADPPEDAAVMVRKAIVRLI